MFSKDDHSKENLGAFFFQQLRVVSGKHKSNRIDAHAELRQTIIKEVKEVCYKAVPNASKEEWNQAFLYIAERLCDE
jgi:hypothetical protein